MKGHAVEAPFTADEIFELAQQIERQAVVLFRRSAEMMQGKTRVRHALLELADLEERHEKAFAQMRVQFAQKGAELVREPDSPAGRYMQQRIDSRDFQAEADPEKLLAGREGARDILEKAVEIERDCLRLYRSLEKLLPAGHERQKTAGIAEEESRHLALLEKELGGLAAAAGEGTGVSE